MREQTRKDKGLNTTLIQTTIQNKGQIARDTQRRRRGSASVSGGGGGGVPMVVVLGIVSTDDIVMTIFMGCDLCDHICRRCLDRAREKGG